jgi:hypothetical protein
MELLFDDYQHGHTISLHDYSAESSSLTSVLSALDPADLLYEVTEFTTSGRPLKPKRQLKPVPGAGRKPFLMPVSQKAMNAAVKEGLRADGWTLRSILRSECGYLRGSEKERPLSRPGRSDAYMDNRNSADRRRVQGCRNPISRDVRILRPAWRRLPLMGGRIRARPAGYPPGTSSSRQRIWRICATECCRYPLNGAHHKGISHHEGPPGVRHPRLGPVVGEAVEALEFNRR